MIIALSCYCIDVLVDPLIARQIRPLRLVWVLGGLAAPRARMPFHSSSLSNPVIETTPRLLLLSDSGDLLDRFPNSLFAAMNEYSYSRL